MTEFHDALEHRSATQRQQAIAAALPEHIAHARTCTTCFAEKLAAIEPATIDSMQALAALPVLRKSELIERQQEQSPFGGLTATKDLARVFRSPGPIHEPQGRGNDFWRFSRALHAAGFRAGGLIHNAFAYHFTPAGFMFDAAGRALGCPVFPAGSGQTELQARALAHFQPRHYTGTPSFLKIILDKADELGLQSDSLTSGLVTAEPLTPSLQAEFESRGLDVYQCYGTADLGLIAYETEAREGLVVDEGVLVEIVRPGTGTPVPDGEVGEVVVTVFNRDYPLVRFATGDLSAVLPGMCPTGRTNMRIRGWMGRADQTTKVRGMFVHPSQIDEVCSRHPAIQRARLVVTAADNRDAMTLYCEVEEQGDSLAEAIGDSLREVCSLRGEARLVAASSLPNDGKVIDDQRTFD